MKNKGFIIVASVVVLGIVSMMLIKRCDQKDEQEVPMEKTMAIIEEVRLRGEIYVCSATIEDYAMRRMTEVNLILPNEEHSCVQTMRLKCSYKIDLEKVEYLPDSTEQVVRVRLPKVEYVASTQSSSFLSDDSNYWAEHLSSTNDMKRKVEQQIQRRFDTPENRRNAELYAEEAIRVVLEKMGLEVEFVRGIEGVSEK